MSWGSNYQSGSRRGKTNTVINAVIKDWGWRLEEEQARHNTRDESPSSIGCRLAIPGVIVTDHRALESGVWPSPRIVQDNWTTFNTDRIKNLHGPCFLRSAKSTQTKTSVEMIHHFMLSTWLWSTFIWKAKSVFEVVLWSCTILGVCSWPGSVVSGNFHHHRHQQSAAHLQPSQPGTHRPDLTLTPETWLRKKRGNDWKSLQVCFSRVRMFLVSIIAKVGWDHHVQVICLCLYEPHNAVDRWGHPKYPLVWHSVY